LANVYEQQMEEGKLKKTIERTQGVEVSRLTKSPLKGSATNASLGGSVASRIRAQNK
jgi:hypothetical protein